MGWLLTFFDLPVGDKEERKEASRFRKNLLGKGFLMLQFSVYARPCVSQDMMQKELKHIKAVAPSTGNVRILYITDHQWKNVTTIYTKNYGKRDTTTKMPKQIEFW